MFRRVPALRRSSRLALDGSMTIMMSYAREDQAAVMELAADLSRAHMDVWVDRELTGGQVWWEAILAQIRSCELFLVALSPDSLRSRACTSELDYAVRLRRPLLPVMVREVAVQLAPPVIADAQIVDYRARSVDAAISLISAVAGRPAAPPLPLPLPAPPPPPISYMNAFGEAVEAPALNFRDQVHLVADLKIYLDNPVDRDAAAQLLQRLRHRRDIVESVGREIDRVLRDAGASSSEGGSTESWVASYVRPDWEPVEPTLDTSPASSRKSRADRGPSGVASRPPELPLLVRRLHLVSGLLIVLMALALALSAPLGPILFFGAAVFGLGLSLVSIQRTGRHPERVNLRRGAVIWAGLWAVLFVLVAVVYLT